MWHLSSASLCFHPVVTAHGISTLPLSVFTLLSQHVASQLCLPLFSPCCHSTWHLSSASLCFHPVVTACGISALPPCFHPVVTARGVSTLPPSVFTLLSQHVASQLCLPLFSPCCHSMRHLNSTLSPMVHPVVITACGISTPPSHLYFTLSS